MAKVALSPPPPASPAGAPPGVNSRTALHATVAGEEVGLVRLAQQRQAGPTIRCPPGGTEASRHDAPTISSDNRSGRRVRILSHGGRPPSTGNVCWPRLLAPPRRRRCRRMIPSAPRMCGSAHTGRTSRRPAPCAARESAARQVDRRETGRTRYALLDAAIAAGVRVVASFPSPPAAVCDRRHRHRQNLDP
jgi:hypothetical protein